MNLEDFFDKYLGGHINLTKKITVYGHNAMHWGVNIKSNKYGYICFRLPLPSFYNNKPFFRPLYFYCSPNATPWACTFAIGNKHASNQDFWFAKAILRREILGHNFSTYDKKNKDILRQINDFNPYYRGEKEN